MAIWGMSSISPESGDVRGGGHACTLHCSKAGNQKSASLRDPTRITLGFHWSNNNDNAIKENMYTQGIKEIIPFNKWKMTRMDKMDHKELDGKEVYSTWR